MRRIGFSTGAIARGDFRTALTRMQEHEIEAVELSALRIDELAPLIEVPKLLERYPTDLTLEGAETGIRFLATA